MSEEYRNSCATYNVPLDISENDVFLIGCAHLYHFLHINNKTEDCKPPMMLKMHLEIDDHPPPSIGEAEEQRNIVENNFNPGLRKTLEQLEEQIKSLREALQQAMEDVVNRIDKAKANPPEDESNSNKKEKKFNRKNNLSGGEHNAISANDKGHQTNSMPKDIDMSLKAAYENVIGIAEKMGIADDWNFRDSIDFIDVFSLKPNILYYSVRFNDKFNKNEFVKRRHRLKGFPETKSLEILDGDGHKLRLRNINNVSMSLASANVIGMAKVMGLSSLATDYLKRVYALNYAPYNCDISGLSFAVEFTSKGVKDEFLKRKHKLHEMGYFYNEIEILDIHEEKNIAVIKYETGHLVTAIQFYWIIKTAGCLANS